MNHDEPPISRIEELLADRALQGLTEIERAELGHLVKDIDDAGQALELAAAEAFLGFGGTDLEELPDSLRSRLELDAVARLDRPEIAGTIRLIARKVVPWLGWVAAAALLFVVLEPRRFPPGQEPADQPSLVQRLANASHLKLSGTEHPLARGASGELVWSSDRQEGYLALRGLAEVDPGRGVYQLWVFDETRDDRFPVDGGTFTVNDAGSTTFVPIRPCLSIRRPTLFAITLEPPSGVVVSDRKRILLTATSPP